MFVVVTRQILTENQAQGVCPEVRGWGGDTGGTGVCVCVCVCPPPNPKLSPLPTERSHLPLRHGPRLPGEEPHHRQR